MTAPILVIGVTGQLAKALAEKAPEHDLTVQCVGPPTLDFDRPESVGAFFAAAVPSLVVNAAAYTAVDAAEDDVAAAFTANRDGPAELARLCELARIPLIHISTDYVFDGLKGAPYKETDAVSPQGVYGASKLAGEQAVQTRCSRAVVLRTSWLYSPTGRNFVRTMLAAGQRNGQLRVVADQRGCPTSATDLARAILAIAMRLLNEGWDDRYAGIWHAAGSGAATWHDLATAAFAAAARHGLSTPVVVPIATHEWPTRAKRPPDSRLDCDKLATVFGLRLPPWQDALVRTVDAIVASQASVPVGSG